MNNYFSNSSSPSHALSHRDGNDHGNGGPIGSHCNLYSSRAGRTSMDRKGPFLSPAQDDPLFNVASEAGTRVNKIDFQPLAR